MSRPPLPRRPDEETPLPWGVRAVTAVFPRDFLERYGTDMRQCVRDARDALGDAPAATRAWFWGRTMVDLASAGMLERIRSRRSTRSRSVPLRLLGFASLAASTANLLVDLLSKDLQMGIGALLLTWIGFAMGALLARPRHDPAC